MESVASVTALSHNKGEKYVAEGGVETLYTEDSTSCSVDSVVLPADVRAEMRAKAIDRVINWKASDKDSIVSKLLAGTNQVKQPELTGVQ
jgi:hypothetical protein